jgi:signal peptidase I
MQPTLFGIHYINGKNSMPDLPRIANFFIHGVERAKLEIKGPGVLYPEATKEYNKFLILPRTSVRIGNYLYQLPGTSSKAASYCHLDIPYFQKGDVLCDGWLSTGDHLFVDRFSHHFTGLKRGDVTVFNTVGLTDGYRKLSDKGYYYIKRLVGLPGDTLRIKDDMVYVTPAGETEEKPITELSPAFEKIYSRKGGYHGHLNSRGAQYLGNPDATFTVPKNCYFMMGDNSNSSLDSRYFGAVPRDNIVGKGFFVFWPVSRRWGLVDTQGPIDVPTRVGFPSMQQQ